ncbi:hypothetical protein [Phreatobacter oligotrophus]|uniref:Uncharacterized protein n=1 Tax=Phreatobacter oligotrophus TaxID=1122261 RepID=A0A2T4YWZ3_9HYPH|nr:hypothetical protein [Phreatobacter oligotrophus]PTM49903.1 hypothetical protein C8P69_11617 [Phreatobacter oligotrophus]
MPQFAGTAWINTDGRRYHKAGRATALVQKIDAVLVTVLAIAGQIFSPEVGAAATKTTKPRGS